MRKTVNKENVEKTEIKWRKLKMNENEEVVNRKEVSWNLEKAMKITEDHKDIQIQYDRGSSSKK